MTCNDTSKLLSLVPSVRFRRVGEEGVLLHLESGRVLVVNSVAFGVLELIKSSPISRTEIINEIIDKYEVERTTAELDIDVFLGGLNLENILVEKNPADNSNV